MKPGNKWGIAKIALLSVMVLTAATLKAQTTTSTTTTTTKTKTKAKTKRTAVKSPAITAADVQALKDALAAQQQQIQQLQQQMQQREAAFQQSQQQAQQQLQQAQSAATDAQAKAASVETAESQEKASVDKLSSDVADVKTTLTNAAVTTQEQQKRFSALEGVVGRFRFGGDIRLRGESFFQSYAGCNANGVAAGKGPVCADRNRARVRVRFGVDGKLNEDFNAGFGLATGSLGDTSANETFTNFFDRKTIGLDKAYITYNPVAHKWLSLTGGKFVAPWYRTWVTFKPDINQEGFDEKLSWDFTTPGVKNFTLQGIQLLFNENNNPLFLGAADSYAVGGQVSTKLDFGFLNSTPSFTILNWRNPDALLNASGFATQATTATGTGTITVGTPPTTIPVTVTVPIPGEGPGCAKGGPKTPPCFYGPANFTNSSFTDINGAPHFLSRFLYADFIWNNQVKTGLARLPFNLVLEYENNLNAAAHPNDFTGKVNPSLGKQSHAYMVDGSIGQVKNRGDVQLGYSWLREEQDAIISSWGETDQRAPTNVLQHRFYGLWRVRSNVLATYTLWVGRSLNPNLQNALLVSGFGPVTKPVPTPVFVPEPKLKRMQFDLMYTF